MVNNDVLGACLSKLNNSEKVSKQEVEVAVVSKITKKVLNLLKKNGYLGEVIFDENKRAGKLKAQLIGRINKCGVIKPRYKVEANEIQRFEQRYLPAKGVGLLIISTSQGIITNKEAKEKNIGGRLIAYCY